MSRIKLIASLGALLRTQAALAELDCSGVSAADFKIEFQRPMDESGDILWPHRVAEKLLEENKLIPKRQTQWIKIFSYTSNYVQVGPYSFQGEVGGHSEEGGYRRYHDTRQPPSILEFTGGSQRNLVPLECGPHLNTCLDQVRADLTDLKDHFLKGFLIEKKNIKEGALKEKILRCVIQRLEALNAVLEKNKFNKTHPNPTKGTPENSEQLVPARQHG